jgi:cytochrome P450
MVTFSVENQTMNTAKAAGSMAEIDRFSMADPATAKCPFDYYGAMRQGPAVHRDPGTGFYWISRHDEVVRAALDAKTFSSMSEVIMRKQYRPRAQELWDAAGMRAIDTLVTADPPEHDDYRNVGLRLFSNETVEKMTPHIAALVNELIDSIAARGEAEFVRDFAARLPGTIVCDEFGLPRADQPKFKTWTDAVIALLDPTISEDREVRLVAHLIDLFQYAERHIQRAATEMPGRVIHTLATMTKRDGTPFSALERSWMLLITFVGGNETTMNMLAMGMRKLAGEPELQSELRRHPDKVPAFVEEMLRLEGSVQALLRVATKDLLVDGIAIPRGANVVLCSGSANRDETQWSDPDSFRLDRKGGKRHLTFGYGRHSCIGMHLARRELVVAFTTLLARLRDIRLAVPASEVHQVPLPFHRAIERLPVKFEIAT